MSGSKKMKKEWAIYAVFATAMLVVAVVSRNRSETIAAIAVSALGGLLVPLITEIAINGDGVRLFLLSRTRYRNTEIRFSVAYLFRIEVGGQYLLIHSNRFKHFQPVGGVFKALAAFESLRTDLGISWDKKISIDAETDRDLRVHVPGIHLKKFVDWYNQGRGRERGCWREFYQELIESGLVDGTHFPYLLFGWVRRHDTGVQYSRFFSCYEYKIAEIFEPQLTPAQIDALRAAVAMHPDKLRFFSPEDLTSRGVTRDDPSAKVAETAELLI